MCKKALVIGATGLLGYGVSLELNKYGWKVRTIGRTNFINSSIFPESIEYQRGNFYDETFLIRILDGIDKVFFFLSSTFPAMCSDSLELEITKTLRGLDYLLRNMKALNVQEIVFPSSGGTVYGNVLGLAKETDVLRPSTSYGLGKKMCEEILDFYSIQGISSTILRVGNVYGTPLARVATQGVIDVFAQKAIKGEVVSIWGDALTSVRDYIFMDDFSAAVAMIGEYRANGVEVYNLSSGVGTTLEEIIQTINKYSMEPLKVKYVNDNATSPIKRIVLNMEKFKKKTGWTPKFNIDSGLAETIARKKMIRDIL